MTEIENQDMVDYWRDAALAEVRNYGIARISTFLGSLSR